MTLQPITEEVRMPRPFTPADRAAQARLECYGILRTIREDVEEFTAKLAMNIDHRQVDMAALRVLLLDAVVSTNLHRLEGELGLACS